MKKRRTKRSSKKVFRFPRLYLTSEMLLAEKILHNTYNRLLEYRNFSRSGARESGWYDVYKTKRGLLSQPKVKFLMLSQDLVELKIDPAVYVKVLSQYGKYQRSRFLPHPTWMASKEAIKVYKWLHKKCRDKYAFESDWKKSLKNNDVTDIKSAMKSSALMLRDVKKNFNLKLFEVLVFLRSEVTPWYWATFITLLKRKSRRDEVLDFLWHEEPELRKSVILCTKFFLTHKSAWRAAKKTLRKHL